MLKKRLIGAAAVLTPIVVLLLLDERSTTPGIWLTPLVAGAGLMGTHEIVGLLQCGGFSVNRWTAMAGSILLLGLGCVGIFYTFPDGCPIGRWGLVAAGAVGAIWICILDEMRCYRGSGGALERIALTVFGVIYVSLPICFLVQLRLLYANRQSLLAVISVIFIVKVADTGAYFAGKSFGKHKMAPILSPKKTWEGAVGALVSAMLAASFFSLVVIPKSTGLAPPAFFPVLGYGAALAVAGMIGDLGESLIKREVHQKDSAGWLPGLGGVLDMLDSLLLAGPVGYLFWGAGILG